MRAHSVWLLIACYVYTRCGTIGQGGTSTMGVRDAKGRRVVVYISSEYSRVRTYVVLVAREINIKHLLPGMFGRLSRQIGRAGLI